MRLVSCLALAAAAGLGGCGRESGGPDSGAENETEAAPRAAVPAPLDDEEYLTRLGLMRGHLLVSHALFETGALAAAQSHAKHPADELYAGLAGSLEARGAAGFADELNAHAGALADADAAAVGAAYEAVRSAIESHELATEPTPKVTARVVVALLRHAAEEYALGVVAGEVENAHEYQDAWAFTQVAAEWCRQAADAAAPDAVVQRAFTEAAERIEALADMWPALQPPPRIEQRAARLYGAAAEVEITTLRI